MDDLMARIIVETLSKGIDPLSGRVLPEDHLCSSDEIQEALSIVLEKCTIESNEQIMRRIKEEKRVQRKARSMASQERFPNQGNKWTQVEIDTLKALYQKHNIWQIANIMGRTPGAIKRELEHLRFM